MMNVIGTGIDIIEIERIQKAIERWGENFTQHVFNSEEIDYCARQKNPFQHYAVRFAAKEAVFKAVGDPQMSWKDLSISHDANGKPVCCYHRSNFTHKIHISLSHSKHYAVANAIVTTGS